MMNLVLNDGYTMPMIGYGTYKVKDPQETRRCVRDAVAAGYRLIDTAQFYDNEKAVGEAVTQVIAEGMVKREELFITTKIWFGCFEDGDCRASLEESFRLLNLDYLDLVLLHWPYGNTFAAWRVLEEYKEAGRIRSIGVSNFEPDQFINLIHYNRIAPAVNQVEGQLFCQRSRERAWMEKYHIVPQAYSPLGSARVEGLLEVPQLKQLGEKYGKTPAQISLRFLMQLGFSVIPKSSHTQRIRENFDLFDFELDDAEMELLKSLDKARPRGGMPEVPERMEEALAWPSRWRG